jgi:hypothetical protein
MRTILLTLFLLGLLPQAGWAQTLEAAAQQAVESLTEELTVTPLEVEIAALTLEGTQASSPFADTFLGHVQDAMLRNDEDYRRVTRREVTLETVTRGLKFTTPNYTSADVQVEDAVLEGTYREAADTLFVQLRLVKTDGSRISSAEVPVALSQITQEYKPSAISRLREEILQLNSLPLPPQQLRIHVSMAKGSGATYAENDPFEVQFSAEEDSYVRLIYRDVNGETIPLWDSPKPLRSGTAHRLPPRSSNGKPMWTVSCETGCGPETLVVVASTSPLPPQREPSVSSSWSLGDYLRGLQQQLEQSPGSPRTAVLTLALTTIKQE